MADAELVATLGFGKALLGRSLCCSYQLKGLPFRWAVFVCFELSFARASDEEAAIFKAFAVSSTREKYNQDRILLAYMQCAGMNTPLIRD